jgi:hypothetical protein
MHLRGYKRLGDETYADSVKRISGNDEACIAHFTCLNEELDVNPEQAALLALDEYGYLDTHTTDELLKG